MVCIRFSKILGTQGLPSSVKILSIIPVWIFSGCQARQVFEFPDPEIRVEILNKSPIKFGEFAELQIKVINSTFQPLLIRSITLDRQLPICMDL